MLHVCFATMTGNAESLANRAHDRAVASGIESTLVNLANAKPADLAGWKQALFVVSTWGDGEPPADACDFWYELERPPSTSPACASPSSAWAIAITPTTTLSHAISTSVSPPSAPRVSWIAQRPISISRTPTLLGKTRSSPPSPPPSRPDAFATMTMRARRFQENFRFLLHLAGALLVLSAFLLLLRRS